MKVSETVDIGELRALARSRLPKIVFDWIEEGAGDEVALRSNLKSFESYRLAPRYLRDVSQRSQQASLFGRTYSNPFGFSPTGMQGIIRCGAELMMAEAAAQSKIPYVLSGLTTKRLDEVAKVGGGNVWYQPYPTVDRRIVESLVRKAEDAGISTLVITADLPVEGRRLRSLRHRRKGRPNLTSYMGTLLHPAWLANYLWHQPRVEDLIPFAPPGARRQDLDELFGSQYAVVRDKQTWEELEWYRRIWPGNLVVKGILHPLDAVRAVELGADGITVSNHGGRQLERAPAPLEAFPLVHAAVGDRVPVMLDGGIRRGTDILIALCLGAKFVFIGRAVLYGLAAGGKAGITRVIEILAEDLNIGMGQIGALSLDQLGPDCLFQANKVPARVGQPELLRSA